MDTVEQFGTEFFENCVTNNVKGLEAIRITKREIESLVISSDLPKEQKEKLIEMFLNKFSDDELLDNISQGLDKFIDDIKQSKGKLKNVSLLQIVDETIKLENLPFTIGNVSIEYRSNGKKGVITVEVMKSNEGWRIFDDVFATIEP